MESDWNEISPEDLKRRLASGDSPTLVDVRTAPEVASYHIPGARWIPLDEVPARHAEIDRNDEVVLICEHGVRSTMACRFLAERGFSRLANMTGGMSAWTGPTENGLPPD
jgi:rhodanese-related sulfurtransferase